jgi:hypothetical protein
MKSRLREQVPARRLRSDGAPPRTLR